MAMQRVREEVERDWHHRLEWMKSLTSLVVIKLGPFGSDLCGYRVVSLLLDDLLCDYLFPPTDTRIIPARPIETIWIQDFEVYPWTPLEYSSPERLKSYRSGDPRSGDEDNVEPFQNLEHLGAMIGLDFSRPLLSLQKLKYASGRASKDEQV